MSTPTLELLERYKEALTLSSDYAVAKALGIRQSTITHWRNGGSMDDTTAVQMADAIGLDPLATMAAIRLSRPLTAREKSVWEKFRGAACVFVIVVLSASSAPMVDKQTTLTPTHEHRDVAKTTSYADLTEQGVFTQRLVMRSQIDKGVLSQPAIMRSLVGYAASGLGLLRVVSPQEFGRTVRQ